jgi:hypothetical protein
MSDDGDDGIGRPFVIRLGPKDYEIDPLTAGQVREVAAAIDLVTENPKSTQVTIESCCRMARAALRIKYGELSEYTAFDRIQTTQTQLQVAAEAILKAAGFKMVKPGEPPGAADGEKKS